MGIRTAVCLFILLVCVYFGRLGLEQIQRGADVAERYEPLMGFTAELVATYPPPGSLMAPTAAGVRLRISAAEQLATHAFYTRAAKPPAGMHHLRETLGELRALMQAQHESLATVGRRDAVVIRLERLQQGALDRLRRATELLHERAMHSVSVESERVARRFALTFGLPIALCVFLATRHPRAPLTMTG